MWKLFILLCVSVHYAVGSAPKVQSSKITEAQAVQIARNYVINLIASQPRPYALSAPTASLPFSAIWDDCTQSLYYADIFARGDTPSLFRFDFTEGKTYVASIVGQETDSSSFGPSFILPVSSECNKYKNQFAVGIGHTTRTVQWDGKSPSVNVSNTIFTIEQNDPTINLAIGRQSEKGILYVGTLHSSFCSGPSNSSIYKYTKKNGIEQLVSGIQTTTGFAFEKNGKILYQLDSCQKIIVKFFIDSNGDLHKGGVVYNFNNNNSSSSFIPIGLEIDLNGFIYTANYLDGIVLRIDSKTSAASIITKLPFGSVTGLVFGGPNRDILFATGGSVEVDPNTASVISTIPTSTSLYGIINVGKGGKYHRVIL